MPPLRRDVPSHVRATERPRDTEGGQDDYTLPRRLQLLLPEDSPIPDAAEFNASGTTSTAAVQANQAIALSPQVGNTAGIVELPKGNVGRIASVIISLTDMLPTTNVTFTLRINSAPVPGYANISMTPRTAPYVANTFGNPGCRILVPQGAQISAVFSNIDGGTYVVGICVGGWYWPDASGKRWIRLGN